MKPCTHHFRRGRLTHKRSLLPFAQVDESTDGLRGGVAQDGVQHRLAKLANDGLTLISVRGGQNVTNFLQQLDHGILQRKWEMRKVSVPHVGSAVWRHLVSTYVCLCGCG